MKKIILILLLCPLFVTQSYAEDLGAKMAELLDVNQVETALPDDARDVSGMLRMDGGYDTEGALHRLSRQFFLSVKAQFLTSLHAATALFSLALLCALRASFCQSKEIRNTIDRIGCCAAALYVFGNFTDLLEQASNTIRELSDYAHIILPVIFTTAAAGGGVVSAPARYSAACLSMDVLITAAQNYILPLIYMYFALSVSQSLYDDSILQAVRRIGKWSVTTALTVLTMAFGAYLSLTGLIAGSGDALAVKTARTVISRSLPIVGGILSDSASVLLSAATLVKNSVGVFALIAVCALCLGPVAAFSVKLLIFKAVAVASDFLPGARLPGLISAMATVFGMLLALIGCCAAILFMAIVSGIKVVCTS